MMTLIRARARAPSVPGRMAMYISAWSAMAILLGSITTTLAPFLRFSWMAIERAMSEAAGLWPQRTYSLESISSTGYLPKVI